jgi:hypothetical protein
MLNAGSLLLYLTETLQLLTLFVRVVNFLILISVWVWKRERKCWILCNCVYVNFSMNILHWLNTLLRTNTGGHV